MDRLICFSILFGLCNVFFVARVYMKSLSLFEKFMLIVGLLVVNAIMMPLVGSLSNRLLSSNKTESKTFELVSFKAKSEQPFGLIDSTMIQTDGFRAIIKVESEEESLYLSPDLKFDHDKNSITIPIRKGFWGYRYVDKIR